MLSSIQKRGEKDSGEREDWRARKKTIAQTVAREEFPPSFFRPFSLIQSLLPTSRP